jgi:hypothetical protein
MTEALAARELLIEQRAATLVDRARTAGTGWLTHLGPEPDEPSARADWSRRACAVAAYRERHGITDPLHPLGVARATSVQQDVERRLAARALDPTVARRESVGAAPRRPTQVTTPSCTDSVTPARQRCQPPMGR